MYNFYFWNLFEFYAWFAPGYSICYYSQLTSDEVALADDKDTLWFNYKIKQIYGKTTFDLGTHSGTFN